MTYRTLHALLFTGLMFIFSMPCYAQDSGNNERSKIVETFKGKQFYIHFVKEGQTLFAITKMYGVPSDVIIDNNPDLKEGLKADMILKIPFKDSIVIEEKHKTTSFFKKKETPTVSQPITNNSQSDIINNSQVTVKNNNPIVYEIKRNETLYGIAKRYNVSMDDILKANPGVTSFRSGAKIHIPVITSESIPATVPSKTIKSNSRNAKENELKTSNAKIPASKTIIDDTPARSSNKEYKVAMLMPFYLDDIDSIRVDQKDPKSFSFVQFYEASLLAIDSLRGQGLNVKLFVYDTDGDEGVDKTRTIFQKKEMVDMDLIIGPFYAKCFEIASRYAGLHKIPIVNPLSKRNEIITAKPWTFKVQPVGAGQMTELVGFINQHLANSNVILVRASKSKMTEEAVAFKQGMQSVLKKQNQLSNYKESFFATEGIEGLTLRLSNDRPNIFVVLSTDEVFVSGLLRKLDAISGKYDLTVMGMAPWEQYKLDIKFMTHLKMHLYSNKYVDFSNGAVQKFSTKFLKEYNTVPEVKKYGFDGFDITYYFLSALMKYGRQFERHLDDYPYQGLQNSFHFHKIEGGGFENTGANFYRFENDKLRRVE